MGSAARQKAASLWGQPASLPVGPSLLQGQWIPEAQLRGGEAGALRNAKGTITGGEGGSREEPWLLASMIGWKLPLPTQIESMGRVPRACSREGVKMRDAGKDPGTVREGSSGRGER